MSTTSPSSATDDGGAAGADGAADRAAGTDSADGAKRGKRSGSAEFAALESVPVATDDGTTFTVRVLAQADPTAPVFLILPAMALKAKFYLPLVKALHRAGVTAATVDLRGQGESIPPLTKDSRFGYREMIEVDLPAVTAAVHGRFPQAPLYLFGHSLGGQLALLHAAANPTDVAGIAVLGTGTVYWRAFGRRWFEALWKIQTIGLVSRVRGHWPGGLLIGGAMAGPVMVDWARHSRTGRYRPRGSNRPYDRLLRELRLPVLVISLAEDTLGPHITVDYLCTRMPAATITRLKLDATSGMKNLDHFAWVADSGVLAPMVTEWAGVR